jgi:hypothetical protein
MNHPQDVLFQEAQVHYQNQDGWVRIYADDECHAHPQLPLYLSGTLAYFFRSNPQLHLRCVVPFSKGGDTVELHAWYDRHVFAPIQPPSEAKPK